MLLRAIAWFVVLLTVAGGLLAPASAASLPGDIYSTNDLGGIGLITMRTARFAPDGQFEVGASFVAPYRRYYMTWQILPRIELTFRYTDVTNVINGTTRSIEQNQARFWGDILKLSSASGSYLDRAFDLKFRIWDEGRIMPAFAIGLQDTIGTGLMSGEYMVFTKRIADFDVTAGLGWGYLATRNTIGNPMRILSGKFDVRDSQVGRGGNLNLGDFFSGPRAGIFMGVEYFTPVKSLSLKLEYGSADPAREPLGNPQRESFPVNVAVNWRPYDWFNVQAGLERGNALMLKMSIRQNFKLSGLPHIMDPPPARVVPRMPPQREPAGDTTPQAKAVGPQKTWLDITQASLAAERQRQSYVANQQSGTSRPDLNPTSFADLLERRVAEQERHEVSNQVARSQTTGAKELSPFEVAALPADRSYERFDGVYTPATEQDAQKPGESSGAVADENDAVAARVFKELDKAGYPVEALEIKGITATVFYQDVRFRSFSKNLGRISRILANLLPPEIEQFTLVYVGKGLETSRVSIMRKDIENAATFNGSPEEIWANAVIETPHVDQSLPRDAIRNQTYPSFTWTLRPTLQQHIGDPDVGLWIGDVRLSLGAVVKLRRNLWVSAGVSKFLFGNLDKIRRGANSVLPHVRSDIKQYVQQGRDSLDSLQISYLFRPAKNVWGRVSAGILEMMYGGVSGELFYRRPGSPFGYSVNLNWVKQRDFNQGFGFRDYEVLTGHFVFHYDLPVYDLHFSTSYGRYLAGDTGMTFDVYRRFKSGVVVGGFFTLTNVSAQDFGEGSFDKGFYMRIPLDMFLLRSSTHTMNFLFRPLTRDGGQQVSTGPSAFGVPNSDDYRHIMESWDDFMK